jgi:hypothetical protein
MKHIYIGDFWVRINDSVYPQRMFQRYPEIYIVGMPKRFYSPEFQLCSEKSATLWKLQGDILASLAGE